MSTSRLVYVVDDDDAVRHSATFMLRHAGYRVEPVESGVAFLKMVKKAERGCVLLDILMPEVNGLAVQKHMIEHGIDMPVIVLTGHGDIETAVQAMRLGAVNFFEKPCEKERLLEGLEEAFGILENEELKHMAQSLAEVRLACLTGRERDVLDGLMKGNSNKDIARDLDISSRTVEVFRANMMEKLRVRNLAGALRIGFAAVPDRLVMATAAQPTRQKPVLPV